MVYTLWYNGDLWEESMEFVMLLQRIAVLQTHILCCTLELLDHRYLEAHTLGNWYCNHRPFFTDHHCRGSGIRILIIISMAIVLLKISPLLSIMAKYIVWSSCFPGKMHMCPGFYFKIIVHLKVTCTWTTEHVSFTRAKIKCKLWALCLTDFPTWRGVSKHIAICPCAFRVFYE